MRGLIIVHHPGIVELSVEGPLRVIPDGIVYGIIEGSVGGSHFGIPLVLAMASGIGVSVDMRVHTVYRIHKQS